MLFNSQSGAMLAHSPSAASFYAKYSQEVQVQLGITAVSGVSGSHVHFKDKRLEDILRFSKFETQAGADEVGTKFHTVIILIVLQCSSCHWCIHLLRRCRCKSLHHG